MDITLSLVQDIIRDECDAIKNLLLAKNAKYGNSAIQPKRIFSKQNSIEQIKVRIDDKLSRIQTMGSLAAADEDTVQDLIGYLILLRVSERVSKIEEDLKLQEEFRKKE